MKDNGSYEFIMSIHIIFITICISREILFFKSSLVFNPIRVKYHMLPFNSFHMFRGIAFTTVVPVDDEIYNKIVMYDKVKVES